MLFRCIISDLSKLKKQTKKQESDDEEVDEDYNPYLDPEDRENGVEGGDPPPTDDTVSFILGRLRSSILKDPLIVC